MKDYEDDLCIVLCAGDGKYIYRLQNKKGKYVDLDHTAHQNVFATKIEYYGGTFTIVLKKMPTSVSLLRSNIEENQPLNGAEMMVSFTDERHLTKLQAAQNTKHLQIIMDDMKVEKEQEDERG